MSDKISMIILAAGEGTRLKLDQPKPLAPIMGRSLIDYPLRSCLALFDRLDHPGHIHLVTGYEREKVEEYVSENYISSTMEFIYQKEQLGTGHAIQTAFQHSSSLRDSDYTFVLCADTPAITVNELESLYKLAKDEGTNAVVATFLTENPFGYGRIVPKDGGFKIVEQKDADSEQRAIKEVNSGLYIFKTSFLMENIHNLSDKNEAGEFYLTDLLSPNYNVSKLKFEDDETFIGVNDLKQLARAERVLRWRHMRELQLQGVRFIDLSHTYIDDEVVIEPGSIIYPNVIVSGKSNIGRGVTIEAGAIIKSSIIEDGANILAYSYLEKALVREKANIGPFARLRPDADIGPSGKIGNFVEVKKSTLGAGAKVSHLSYVGDAEIGEQTNIGCGFITCNYDGVKKHKTIIGKNSFIGSDSQTVAPVKIGNNCFVASGSTINKDMPDDSFAISRCRQVTKEGIAERFLKTKK